MMKQQFFRTLLQLLFVITHFHHAYGQNTTSEVSPMDSIGSVTEQDIVSSDATASLTEISEEHPYLGGDLFVETANGFVQDNAWFSFGIQATYNEDASITAVYGGESQFNLSQFDNHQAIFVILNDTLCSSASFCAETYEPVDIINSHEDYAFDCSNVVPDCEKDCSFPGLPDCIGELTSSVPIFSTVDGVSDECQAESARLQSDPELSQAQQELYARFREDYDQLCDFSDLTSPSCNLKFDSQGDNSTYVETCSAKGGKILAQPVRLVCLDSLDFDLGVAPICLGESCDEDAVDDAVLSNPEFQEFFDALSFAGCEPTLESSAMSTYVNGVSMGFLGVAITFLVFF